MDRTKSHTTPVVGAEHVVVVGACHTKLNGDDSVMLPYEYCPPGMAECSYRIVNVSGSMDGWMDGVQY
jgi:hypothetical protein